MGVPLSCGPVLVWSPVAQSIDRALCLGNEGMDVVGAVLVPARSWLWSGILPVGLEPTPRSRRDRTAKAVRASDTELRPARPRHRALNV